MIKLNHLIKDHLLYEGLIHSVSLSRLKDMIENWAVANDKIDIVEKNNRATLNFKRLLNDEEIDNLLKLINTLGWYVSAYLTSKNSLRWKKYIDDEFKKDKLDLVSIQVEAKFDLDVTDVKYNILYHISPSINAEKISKIGLVPKTSNIRFAYPDRIYLSDNKNNLELVAKKFYKLDNKKDNFSIYEIDINGAKKDNAQLRLFKDPNFEGGVYTLSNIHPKFIKILGVLNVKI